MTNNLWYPKQNPFLSLQSLGGGAAGYMISAGGGGTTVDFDGDDYLIVASSADLSFGTGDFAVEFWAYADDFGERGTFYDTRASSGTTGITIGHEQTTGEIRVYENATSGSDILLQSTDFDTGGWYHIAVTNSGGTLRLFINGIEKGSATARNLSNTNAVNIGYRTYTSSGYSYFDGKITNLRAVKGSAVYTAAFTPPSSALTNITNTKLLCCNQSSVTGKDVGPTITTSGDPTSSESTPFPFEPEYSVHFDGSNDRLSIADNTDFEFGSGDFTVEAWVKQPNQAGSGADSSTIVNKWHNTSGAKEWILRIDNGSGNNNLQWIQTTDGNSNQFTTGNTALANDTWYHVAAVGDSGTIKLFVNGTLQSSTGTQGTINSYSNPLYFGYNLSSNGQWMDGEISNARIVKGQALYTSSFTAPTSPLTTTSQGATASNVKLLCCNKSSATANTVAPSGLSDNESPTTGTATIGGTASTPYVDFDNADGLNVAADSNLSLGTGVFTIECWVYLDSAPGTGSPGYARVFQLDGPSGNSDQKNLQITINPTGGTLYTWAYDGSAYISIAGSTNLQGAWHHIAVVRDSSDVLTQYVDGSAEGNQSSVTKDFNPNSGSPRVRIGQYDTGGTNGVFNGKISNLRVLVGTALYTSNFTTPNPPLTNITNTQLLCCQSSSSTTAATVGPSSIVAEGAIAWTENPF